MNYHHAGAALLLAAASAIVPLAQAATPTNTQLALQGCNVGAFSTTFNATPIGPWLTIQPQTPTLVGCLSLTGYGASKASIGVTHDGSVYYYPAYTPSGNGVVKSSDSGTTWQAIVPNLTSTEQLGRTQPIMFLDQKTDKIFLLSSLLSTSNLGGTGFHLTASTNAGQSWNYTEIAKDGRDWVKILAGPPVTSTTQGYPNVLYASLPTPISTPLTLQIASIQLPDHQQVYRSLDGGNTWTSRGSMSLKTYYVPGCPSTEFILYGDGAVGADGSIYLGLRRCNHLGIAISRDEGATWTVNDVPGTTLVSISNLLQVIPNPEYIVGEPFSIDAHGNLYAVWTGSDQLLHMTVSKDKGATWSTPVVVSGPGVTNVRFSAVTNNPVGGTLAIAYYGSTDSGKTYNAYIEESANGTAPNPAFRAITANNPNDPLFPNGFQAGYVALLFGGDLNEYIQLKYAPNGDLWASFLKDMCNGLPLCTWSNTHTNSRWQGAAARLLHE